MRSGGQRFNSNTTRRRFLKRAGAAAGLAPALSAPFVVTTLAQARFRLTVADFDSPSYFVAIAAVELGFFKQRRHLSIVLFLEHTQGCHSFTRRDRGECRRANEHTFLRCRKQFDVLAVDIDGTRQELPIFDSLAKFRQSEE